MLPRYLALILLTAAVLLWPAYVNGGPFWFPDTSTYIRSADAATVSLTGSPSEWSDRIRLGEEGPVAIDASRDNLDLNIESLRPTRPVFSGRSIYYGFLIYIPIRFAGPWGAVAVQSLLVATMMVILGAIALRTKFVTSGRALMITGAAVAAISPLPFYTAMLMPDVFAGVLVLTLAMVIVQWEKLSRFERVALIAACGVFAAFHTTHFLLTVIMGGLGALLYLPRKSAIRPILIAAPVLLVAVGASALFTMAVVKTLHAKPISPPFLTARLQAAGPGKSYLDAACSADPDAWAVCPYRAKLPVGSDAFLWQEDPAVGVFQLVDPDVQRRMAGEDKRLAAAILRDRPIDVLWVTAESGVRQLFSFDLDNFNYPWRRVEALSSKYPQAIARDINLTRATQNTMPTGFTVLATIIASVGSLMVIVWIIGKTWRSSWPWRDPGVVFAALVTLGVFANAAICGGLSGEHARYQMRLVWILMIAAFVIAARYRRISDSSLKAPAMESIA